MESYQEMDRIWKYAARCDFAVLDHGVLIQIQPSFHKLSMHSFAIFTVEWYI